MWDRDEEAYLRCVLNRQFRRPLARQSTPRIPPECISRINVQPERFVCVEGGAYRIDSGVPGLDTCSEASQWALIIWNVHEPAGRQPRADIAERSDTITGVESIAGACVEPGRVIWYLVREESWRLGDWNKDGGDRPVGLVLAVCRPVEDVVCSGQLLASEVRFPGASRIRKTSPGFADSNPSGAEYHGSCRGGIGVPMSCLFETGCGRLPEAGEARVCKTRHAALSTAEREVIILKGESEEDRKPLGILKWREDRKRPELLWSAPSRHR